MSVEDRKRLRMQIFHSIRKLDVLQQLVDDDTVTEIMINGTENIFIERNGALQKYEGVFESREKLEDVIQQIVAGCNRVVNESSPIVDARLTDGSRVNVVLNPVALNGPIVTIRRFPEKPITMEKLVALGSISEYLRDYLSVLVKAGYNIFISGGTGSGKTTIMNLICRFYDVTDGNVLVDGTDVRDVTQQSLRSFIGIVQQDVYLFNGTIRDNIAYGKQDAAMDEIIEAAGNADLLDFIEGLPDGFDTQVGERGTRLSGGQKQRIAIARVFLKNPPILILDEATSALDNESERYIQDSLDRLAQGRTTITIAHRLSTILGADEIIVLDDEGIKERGSHKELIKLGGLYEKYYRMQLSTI